MLVDCPCKFVVELPGHKGHEDGSKGHEAWLHDQKRLDLSPELDHDEAIFLENDDGVVDLVDLNRGIDQDAEVVNAETDDLNCVFQAQRVVDQNHLVNVTKHEDGEVGGDGSRLGQEASVRLER